jgi:hypothetical protein
MTITTIATGLRNLACATVIAGAAAVGMTALGDLATADAKAPKSVWVIGNPNAPQNCRLMGGVWVWDGFEAGHCEGGGRGPVLAIG